MMNEKMGLSKKNDHHLYEVQNEKLVENKVENCVYNIYDNSKS